ncbi:sensor domain-containing protein [Cognatilysobacter bugurensis]|uniref:Membrane protein n=1 Tax=Cognatilysobacter bugurensis TaxID=543356 RepID=A0A918SS49_9GAMM|nr:sensor domain-containing protein [Lysobacter bugurensis]GHA68734.1 membrane protein [Lysobacter bugurensis]
MNASHDAGLAGARRYPATIPDYLEHLKRALAGADPALVQDALYDAEEYLRSELAENPGRSEAEVIASVASSYGAPDEVADIYRDTEVRVQTALQPPKPRASRSALAKFFGVALEPRTYAALFYMLLSIATGVFYFTWVVTGVSLSLGLSVLIIGIPFLILFFGSVRVLSLVEGRLVEAMLGERMPRRPRYATSNAPLLERIMKMFVDPRTWATMLYMLLMLPLGIVYFTVVVTALATSLSLVAAPVLLVLVEAGAFTIEGLQVAGAEDLPWTWPLIALAGIALLFVTLHLVRGIGRLHGQLAKHMLVKSGTQHAV